MSDEIYVSVDVETDGPDAATNSLLSIGAAAYKLAEGETWDSMEHPLSTFSVNMLPADGAVQNRKTMEGFWAHCPEAWQALMKDRKTPNEGMKLFESWLGRLGGKCVAFSYPAAFDWPWIDAYFKRYRGRNPFSGLIDLKTLAWSISLLQCAGADTGAALPNEGFPKLKRIVKRNMPDAWFDAGRPHTHVALDDAIEQGTMFIRIVREINLT